MKKVILIFIFLVISYKNESSSQYTVEKSIIIEINKDVPLNDLEEKLNSMEKSLNSLNKDLTKYYDTN